VFKGINSVSHWLWQGLFYTLDLQRRVSRSILRVASSRTAGAGLRRKVVSEGFRASEPKKNGPQPTRRGPRKLPGLFYLVVLAFVGSRRPNRVSGEVLVFVSPPFVFLVLGQLGTHGSGHSSHVNLVADCSTCEIGVVRKRLLGVIAGAIQVGHQSADNEGTVEVGPLSLIGQISLWRKWPKPGTSKAFSNGPTVDSKKDQVLWVVVFSRPKANDVAQ
jgi:hypothetical protein